MKLTTLKGTITGIERLNCSYYGNPRFLVTIDKAITLQTKSDYAYNYDIENLYYSKKEVVIEYYYTKKGSARIQTIKEVE